MNRTVLSAAVFCLLCGAAFSDNPTTGVLARDRVYAYTLSDLETWLEITDFPAREEILDTLSLGEKQHLAPAKQQLEDLAFRRLYVHDSAPLLERDPVLREQVRAALRELAVRRFADQLREDVSVSDEELRSAYENRKTEFRVPERRKISILYKVFPPDPQGREAVLEQLQELRFRPDIREAFQDLVKQHSDLPGALQGGVVDYFTTGTYGPTVETYAFSTPEGEVSPVFHATKGAYLLKVLDVDPARVLSLQEVRARLEQSLMSEKLTAIQARRLERLRSRIPVHIADLASADFAAKPGQPLLRVGDYELTSATLAQVYGEAFQSATYDSERLYRFLEALAERELIYRGYKNSVEADPQAARTFGIEQDLIAFSALFYLEATDTLDVTDEEKRAVYESRREFYHGNAPKRLEYLLFTLPDRSTVSEPVYYREWTDQRREAEAFQEQAAADPERFEGLARELAGKETTVQFHTTDWIQDLPTEWNPTKPLVEYNKGMISSILSGDGGWVVFRVLEVGEPEIFPYKEVEDRLHRLVLAGKEKGLQEKRKRELFEKYPLQFLPPLAGDSDSEGSRD